MKAPLATRKDDILPLGAANTGGSQRPARSPECAPFFPNLNLGDSRIPPDCYTVTLQQNTPVCTRPNRL